MLAALALAGCATLGGPPSAKDDALYATSQSNLASLTEVIEKHPDDPQAYNMRGSVLAQAGSPNGRSPISTRRSASIPTMRRPTPTAACSTGRPDKLDLALADYNKALSHRRRYAPAYLGRGIVYRQQGTARRRSTTSTRRSRSSPTTPRPITIAACSIRASISTSSPSTISPPPSGWRRRSRSLMWRAR